MDKPSTFSSKNVFLLSFFPAIAYWYLESHFPIHIAVIGGISLATIEILIEVFFFKHVHSLSKFNFFLIVFLGGISLVGSEGIWFKLQPALSGWVMGGFLLYRKKKGKGLMVEMIEQMNNDKKISIEIVSIVEEHFSFFIILYGFFMAGVALGLNTDYWLFFKTIGFYIVFILFLIVEFIYLRYRMKKIMTIDKSQ